MVFRRASESRAALLELVKETGAEAVLFNHLYDPISLVRDNEVKTAMQQLQVPLCSLGFGMCLSIIGRGLGKGGGDAVVMGISCCCMRRCFRGADVI